MSINGISSLDVDNIPDASRSESPSISPRGNAAEKLSKAISKSNQISIDGE